MKIAFNILVTLACGVAIYFSLSHKEKFEKEQSTRLSTIETNKNVTASADATDAEIKKQQAVLDQSIIDRDTANARLDAATATGRTLESEVNDLIAQENSQKAELAELDKTLEAVAKIVAELGAEMGQDVNMENLGDKIKELDERRLAQQTTLEELESNVASAEKSLANKQAEARRLVERTVNRNNRIATNSTEAVLTAVDQDWGFVVIGAGSNSGFAPQAPLLVKRDGRLIGRIRPSSIEPTQTIAEIDQKSLAIGVRLQPGDRVMLATPAAN